MTAVLQGSSDRWNSITEKLYSYDLITTLWTAKPTNIIFPSFKYMEDISPLRREGAMGPSEEQTSFVGLERASQCIAGHLLPSSSPFLACSESEWH